MNIRALYLILTLLIIIGCRKSKYESEQFKIKVAGENRTYLLHFPTNWIEADTTSLIIALHGGTGSAKNIEDQSGLSALSDEKGFIACYPDGLHRTWNAGECCGKASSNNVNDVQFIAQLIDQLLADFAIDPKRVYITGMSNGGFMCYRLACELSDKIAAIAPVACSMTFDDCSPENPVSVIHFHSELDANIPFEGGVGNGLSDHYNPPVDSVFKIWGGFNGCSVQSEIDNSDHGYILKTWSSCADSSDVHYYMTADGGHSWPMGKKPRKQANEPSQVLDANALMWEFFKDHPKK